jgi:hypothetical protein
MALSSSAFRYQNRQQDLPVRPRRCHRSEARLFRCTGHSPSRSRGTWRLPFAVCMAHRLSPLSSCLPSLSAALLTSPVAAPCDRGTVKALTPAHVHPEDRSPRLPRPHLPIVPSPTTQCAPISLSPPPQRIRLLPGFTMESLARRNTTPNRVRPPTDRQFASGCSPPRRTMTRNDAVTFGYGAVAHSDTDFHRAGLAPSRAHDPGLRRDDLTRDSLATKPPRAPRVSCSFASFASFATML